MKKFDVPILMLVFNRPELTKRVLNRILEINPSKLYVVADGARENKEGEKGKVEETRELFIQLSNDIEVITLFREKNLGCKKSVSGGITWFFEQEERGIILEDDCLPDLSFFPFTEALLERYKDVEDVMHIGGNNFQKGILRGDASYYFSIWPHIWGWATWRRAWNSYQVDVENISSKDFNRMLDKMFETWNEKEVFRDIFFRVKKGGIDTWDYQWMFQIWHLRGKAILPNYNLVSNIGFGADASHCTDSDSEHSNLQTQSILPIQYANDTSVSKEADNYTLQQFWKKNWKQNLYRKSQRFLRGSL